MRAPRVGDGTETSQAITDDLALRIKAALGEAGQRTTAEAGDPTQLQVHRFALGRGLNRRNEWRLAGGAPTALAPRAFAAEIGVVQFDPTTQLLAGVALHHHLRQLVLDLPGRGLRHAEAAAKLDAGDALLALGQLIHGAEPEAQRQVGRGEDRACDRRGLAAAGVALEQPTGSHLAIRPPATGRAFEAIRPSRRDHRRPAFLLGAVDRLEARLTEAFLKLHLVPSHCRIPLNFLFTLCTRKEWLRKVRK